VNESAQSIQAHPYDALTPDVILNAVESQGHVTDGRLLALNSYENRVYQVGIEGRQPLIAKFYRPRRWSDAQILEEHSFCFELTEHELPVVAPLADHDGNSLFTCTGFRFSLYPRKGGHAPELDDLDNLLILGRLLARLHAVGAARSFDHRPALTLQSHGYNSVAFVSEHCIPTDLSAAYDSLTADLLSTMQAIIDALADVNIIRVHGDCHVGNMLWRDETPHFVDLDDACMAPAIQDLWMLLSGDRDRRTAQLGEILDGYYEFYDLDLRELRLIETLRTLRMLHYSAWLGRRWGDPAFPRNFPWFNTHRYWEEHILQLREQLAALNEPPLALLQV
jgi:Ser/Thr protein kinase RdoA (MazF antagonist)